VVLAAASIEVLVDVSVLLVATIGSVCWFLVLEELAFDAGGVATFGKSNDALVVLFCSRDFGC
jgi:hypothetical protein